MSDDEVPPPYSEQELDRKIAQALVISVQQHQSPSQQDLTDDGEWEQWDEAVFSAAQARRNRMAIDPSHIASSASQTYERRESYNASPLPVPGAVQPLRLHKRSDSSVGASASWMGDVIGEEFYGSSSSGHAVRNEFHRMRHDIPPDSDDDDRSIPPPPFTSVGPRMDGSLYHPESTPPSPLNSPPPDHHLPLPLNSHLALNGHNLLPANPHMDSVRLSPQPGIQRPPQHMVPISARSPNYHPQQRPASVGHPHQNSASSHLLVLNQPTHPSRAPDRPGQRMTSTHPLMQIQPSHNNAYLSTYKITTQTLPSQSQSFVASSLYNSSVSGHLSTPMSMQPRESHSSRQHRSAQTARSPPLQHNTLHMPDHASSSAALPLGSAPANYFPSQSTSNFNAQGSLPSQHPTSATYFPQHPTIPTQYGDPTVPRWATSEQQLNQNFQQ